MRYIQPSPILCAVFAVFASYASAAPAPLILNEIHQTGGQGKPLDLRVEEVSRDAKTSTVEIRFVSGASVPSSMFIMHAIYDIARARGDRYFVKLSEHVGDAGKRTMLIGFSREKVVDVGSYYDTAHIQNLDGKLEQLDTDMFDLVFKKQELPKDK
ncbi:hypothetical protein ACO0LO_16005 [Undibacterium sp. TJN25]|uniref:hypothetical protein n=1 Tax=Undibacterium sp. TJN25 TaxID=3413056 RepID=UPI003BF2EFF8